MKFGHRPGGRARVKAHPFYRTPSELSQRLFGTAAFPEPLFRHVLGYWWAG